MSDVHLIADENLGGVLREFVEVERKADVGDYVVKNDIIRKVTNRSDQFGGVVDFERYFDEACSVFVYGWQDGYYKTLEPTDIVVIDNKRYHMVERKAEVGEKVIVTNAENTFGKYDNGSVLVAEKSGGIGIYNKNVVTEESVCNPHGLIAHDEYRVLMPLESTEEPLVTATADSPESMLDLIANLARRLTDIEQRMAWRAQEIDALHERINSVANDIERVDADVERLKHDANSAITITLDGKVVAKLIERGLNE